MNSLTACCVTCRPSCLEGSLFPPSLATRAGHTWGMCAVRRYVGPGGLARTLLHLLPSHPALEPLCFQPLVGAADGCWGIYWVSLGELCLEVSPG